MYSRWACMFTLETTDVMTGLHSHQTYWLTHAAGLTLTVGMLEHLPVPAYTCRMREYKSRRDCREVCVTFLWCILYIVHVYVRDQCKTRTVLKPSDGFEAGQTSVKPARRFYNFLLAPPTALKPSRRMSSSRGPFQSCA